MSGSLIVDAETLSETPEAFQEYVAEFFIEKKMLGKRVFVASTVLFWNWEYASPGGKPRGIAPSHSVDLMRFKTGLKKDQSLNDWISKAEGKYLWSTYSVDEHRGCGACDDD